jgi:YNFM family putative membrane transporter
LFTTVLAFCSLYAPQPILPVLAEHLEIEQSQASLLITLVLLPLSLAPVFYGFVLEAFSARTLLRRTVLLLAASLVPFLFSDEFLVLCAARLLQGLLLPAVFTALMTYCSNMAGPQDLGKTMSLYIAATISGGFLGRAVTGMVADWGDWRHAFLLWIIGLVAAWLMLGRLPSDNRTSVQTLKPRMILEVIRRGEFRRAYLIAFSVFFVFASVLNVLPFEMKRLDPEVSEATIALAYSGYLIGILVALSSGRMISSLGSEARVIRVALIIYGVGLALFSIRSIPVMYATMVLFCAGMFTIHSVISTYVNHLARTHKGVVNGLYVSFYYGGGTLGSYLPVLIYRAHGWTIYLLVLACLVGFVAVLSMGMRGAAANSVRLS